MSREPDLGNMDCRESLKAVLKWEIDCLLQRLADVGEETVVLTANVIDDSVSYLGSMKGQGFVTSSDLDFLKTQFLSYCKDCDEIKPQIFTDYGPVAADYTSNISNTKTDTQFSINHGGTNRRKILAPRNKSRHKRTLMYRNLHDTLHRNHATRLKTLRSEQENITQDSIVPPQLLGDQVAMMPTGVSDSAGDEEMEDIRNKAEEIGSGKGKSSRRKHTPKKLVSTSQLSDEDTGSITLTDRLMTNVSDTEFDLQTVKIEPVDSDGQGVMGSEDEGNQVYSCRYYSDGGESEEKLVHMPGNSLGLTDVDSSPQATFDDLGDVGGDQLSWLPTLGNQSALKNESFSVLYGDLKTPEQDNHNGISRQKSTTTTGVFKPVHPDESPVETVVLDKSKRGVRKYQCPYCDLLVRDRHDLKRHLRTHTKEKPYGCDICGRKFSRKWDQLNHARKHGETDETHVKDEPGSMSDEKPDDLDTSGLSGCAR